jgi:hypothetical protein
MDDSDLAGPFLFCALFGTFLLLVSPTLSLSNSEQQAYDPTVRKAMVRLRLRSRHPRRHQPELHLLHDVPSPHPRRSQPSTAGRPRRLRLSPLLYPHNRPLQLSSRLLPAAPRHCIAHRRPATSRLPLRLLPGQPRHRMVHILKFGHVLQCGQDDGDERASRVSSGAVLCGLWNHGYLQQQGKWKTRGHEGWRLNANGRLMEGTTLCMSDIKIGSEA